MGTLPTSENDNASTWGVLAIVLLLTFLVSYWITHNIVYGVDYWRAPTDYAALTLGHAVNIDQWLFERGGRIDGFTQRFHPGIPLQILSWITYRVSAAEPFSGPQSLFLDTLRDPGNFWRGTQVAALLLGTLGVFIVWLQARSQGAIVALAAGIGFFVFPFSWYYGIARLGNESFALAACGLFLMYGRKALHGENPGGWRGWSVFGALGGIAYLIKLNYLVWSIGALLGLFVTVLVGGLSWRGGFKSAAAFLAGFVGAVGVVAGLFLGGDQLERMLQDHFKVIQGTGKYGEGSRNFVDPTQFMETLISYVKSYPLFFIIIGTFILATCVMVFLRRRDIDWLRKHAPEATMIATVLVLGVASALKHPGEHYLIPAAAFVPFALLWLVGACGPLVKRAAVTLVIVAVVASGRQSLGAMEASFRSAEIGRGDVLFAYTLPLKRGQLRLWTYRVASPEYIGRFAVQNSAIKKYSAVVDTVFPYDHEFNIWRNMLRIKGVWHSIDKINWKYAILDKAYAGGGKLPEPFRNKAYKVRERSTILIIEKPNLP